MEFTAEQIAEILQGEIVGDKTITVKGLAKIEEGQPQALSFLSNPKSFQNSNSKTTFVSSGQFW